MEQLSVPVSQHVKDLGRKARERLQEQRAKRREIVRLEKEPTEPVRPLLAPRPVKRTLPGIGMKRKRAKPQTLNHSVEDAKVDSWYPEVASFEKYIGDERSSLVRLHGLPMGCKPEAIRRFFSTLNPERVIVLLSMDRELMAWDAPIDASATTTPRHASTFRVHVKFPSAPLANLATDRTGEILFTGIGEDKMGVKIAVTQVSKLSAQWLLKHMVRDDGQSVIAYRGLNS